MDKVIRLPGKPAGFIHLGNNRYIVSGFSQPNKNWAFVLEDKENIQNLECGQKKE
ncbi:hypothetical protein [Aliikangiella maris]|uniref:Uncharacterized protein n=2 Tax=Aliikangiella maris TaxID=3162458 RepID=A0ABV2BWJ7_9GAMM